MQTVRNNVSANGLEATVNGEKWNLDDYRNYGYHEEQTPKRKAKAKAYAMSCAR